MEGVGAHLALFNPRVEWLPIRSLRLRVRRIVECPRRILGIFHAGARPWLKKMVAVAWGRAIALAVDAATESLRQFVSMMNEQWIEHSRPRRSILRRIRLHNTYEDNLYTVYKLLVPSAHGLYASVFCGLEQCWIFHSRRFPDLADCGGRDRPGPDIGHCRSHGQNLR